MKRREFIINSAILAGGATHLGGLQQKRINKIRKPNNKKKI